MKRRAETVRLEMRLRALWYRSRRTTMHREAKGEKDGAGVYYRGGRGKMTRGKRRSEEPRSEKPEF